MEGDGDMWFANGDHYEGAWLNNRRHGPGKYTLAAGDTFVGESVRGRSDSNARC